MNNEKIKETRTIKIKCPKCEEEFEIDIEVVATYEDPNVEITEIRVY